MQRVSSNTNSINVTLRQCLDNISNAKVMFTAQCSRRSVHGAKLFLTKFLCWVDNYHQPYNALPTGNQDIVSSLAQCGAN